MLQAMQPKVPPLPAALKVKPVFPDIGSTMKIALAIGEARRFSIPSIIKKLELTCKPII